MEKTHRLGERNSLAVERDGNVQRIVRFSPLHRSTRTEMQETQKQFLLISGISGSGKTAYGRHLEEEKGFYFFPTDDRWKDFTEEMPSRIEGLEPDSFGFSQPRRRPHAGHIA